MFAGGPRRVKCARCGHRWTGEPEPEVPAAVVPEEPDGVPAPRDAALSDADSAIRPVETKEPDFSEVLAEPPLTDAARRMDRSVEKRRTPGWVWVGWSLVVIVVAATALGLIFMRSSLVEAWPPLRHLYGLAANPSEAGPPVTLRLDKSSIDQADGTSVMKLELTLTNLSDSVQPVPVAEVDLIGADGNVIKTGYFRVSDDPMKPSEIRPAGLILQDVPASVERVRASASWIESGN